MLLERVGTRLCGLRQAVVDVPPMIGRDSAGSMPSLDGVDELEYVLDLRPAFDLEQDVAARAHERQRLIGLARRHGAHDVDARGDRAEIVGAQRTNTKTLPAGGETMRRRRSRICSWTSPNRINIRSSSQSRSVRHGSDGRTERGRRRRPLRTREADGASHGLSGIGRGIRASRSRSMSATVTPRRKAAILMRRAIRGDVDGQSPRSAEVSGRAAGVRCMTDPVLGIAGPGGEATFLVDRSHGAILPTSAAQRGDLARGRAVVRPRRPGGRTAPYRRRRAGRWCCQHRRIVIGEGPAVSRGDDGSCAASVQHEAGRELRTIDARLAEQRQHLGRGPAVEWRRLHRDQDEIGGEQRQNISPATRGGPSMTM